MDNRLWAFGRWFAFVLPMGIISYRLMGVALALVMAAGCDSQRKVGDDGGGVGNDLTGVARDVTVPSPDLRPDSRAGSCKNALDCPTGEVCECLPCVGSQCMAAEECPAGFGCVAAPACVDVPSTEALVIDLGWRGEELWARVHNRSCKALYRSRRCGKELEPTLQVLKPGVSHWQVADCVSGAGDACAEAPSCVRLGPNESYDVRIASLDGCGDCSGTFRASFLYFDESTCEQRGGKLQIAEDLMSVEQQACP